MSGNLRWRLGSVIALVVLFAYLTIANFVPKERRVESGLWPDDGLRLGLDLQGGIHWVVGVDLDSALQHELEYVRETLLDALEGEDVTPALLVIREEALVVEDSWQAVARIVKVRARAKATLDVTGFRIKAPGRRGRSGRWLSLTMGCR